MGDSDRQLREALIEWIETVDKFHDYQGDTLAELLTHARALLKARTEGTLDAFLLS